jgi:flagellar hook-associated protein 3 FlgL
VSMRITTGMVSRNVLSDINATAERLNRTRSKASSGREIERPSDDPFAAARALKLRETIDATGQHQRNAQDALGFLEATELGLAGMTDAVHRVRALVVQGGTDSVDLASSKAIAVEVRGLIEAVKEHGNAQFAGRYVFAGTETTTLPFPPSAPPPAAPDVYAGDDARIAREIGPGVSVLINQPGSAVLGTGAPGDLLGVLRQIADHLETGDRAALRGTDLAALDGRLDALLTVRADNGATSERLDVALSRLAQFEEGTLAQLSETEDADLAEVMISLTTQQAAYEAALRSGANIVQASLMDFLR